MAFPFIPTRTVIARAAGKMAPRNLRKKRVAESDSEEDEDAGQQSLQERIEDARTLIKNRVKAKVRAKFLHSPPSFPSKCHKSRVPTLKKKSKDKPTVEHQHACVP